MCDLFDGVDAGIGSAGTYQLNPVVSHKADGFFDMLLNRYHMLLSLPTTVSRAGVFNAYCIFNQ
jgi:hypothetical protein